MCNDPVVIEPGTDSVFTHESLPGRVVFGAGRAAEIASEVDRLETSRVLVIAGEPSQAELLESLLSGRVADTIIGAPMHVPVAAAEDARERARRADVGCVVAIGGGSSTGLAKAVALTTGLPIIVVPTTYAGSEMTPIWGLTDGDVKTTGRDLAVLPRTVVYDPDLTWSLPAGLSASSGLNAIAHCVEAMWGPGTNPLVAAVAEEGIRAMGLALPAVMRDPNDGASRAVALRGAWLGGLSLASAGTALHHKLCHVLGGMGLPHAETHAIVLPYVTAFLSGSAPDAATRVARALRADDGAEALFDLRAGLGIPAGLREIGLEQSQLARVVELAVAVAPALPRQPNASELAELLDLAYRGAPLAAGAALWAT